MVGAGPRAAGFRATLLALFLCLLGLPAHGAEPSLLIASTTSTENSGLFDYLLPMFTKQSGITVHVVARGTGQAIRIAQNGDADLLFVHDKQSEERFVAEGFGIERFDVMYNDFVIVGPPDDPAGIAGSHDVVAAFRAIAGQRAIFVSRGDTSGTHKAELRLWRQAAIDPVAVSGAWYREVGAGMGAVLNTANAMGAYTLTDRGSWRAFANRSALKILLQGDPRLFNQYGIIPVNPAKFPHLNGSGARAFVDWITSPKGQALIASFRISGEQAFFSNYLKSQP